MAHDRDAFLCNFLIICIFEDGSLDALVWMTMNVAQVVQGAAPDGSRQAKWQIASLCVKRPSASLGSQLGGRA